MHKCQSCHEKFESEEALNQHRIAKHERGKPLKEPSRIKKSYIIYSVMVIVIIGLVFLVSNSPVKAGQYDQFAKCLTEKGVKFYGAFWCPRCAEQKVLFGKSIEYVNYIECSTPDRSAQTQVCITAKIEGYPTWEFADKTRASGVLSLEELSAKSGCSLEANNLSEANTSQESNLSH